jgi:hypothetical protein
MLRLKHFTILVVLVLFGVLALQQYRARYPAKPAAPQVDPATMAQRTALLKELETVTLQNCELTRMGSPNDAGYLMCKNLMDGIKTAYSYGIGWDDKWGCDVSVAHKVPVHQYDCFAPSKLQCAGGVFKLNAECVGPRKETIDGRPFDTIENQIARNGDTGKKMVLKMDIEGAEWKSVLATPDSVFDSISQMPMELHGVDEPEVLEGLRKLKTHFYLVSVHFNNWSCNEGLAPIPAWAYQVLLVNKRIGVVGTPPAGSPTAASLLTRDGPSKPDCQLPGR